MEKIFITEKQLEDFIFNTNPEKLEEKGIALDYYKIKRQVKIGNYGVADLVSIKRPQYKFYKDNSNIRKILYKGCITIYELKRDSININALLQACRYLNGIKRYLEKRGIDLDHYNFEIKLIGSDLETNGDFIYLLKEFKDRVNECYECEVGGLVDIYLYSYNMTIDGISFEYEDTEYNLTKEGF